MQKHLTISILLILLFSIKLNLQAQEWFPIGAKWRYSTEICNNPLNPYCGYYEVEVVGDTLLGGDSARVLRIVEKDSGSTYWASGDLEIMYEDSDRVYRWYGGKYHVLYDFNLQVGDTLTIQDSTEFRGYLDHVHGFGMNDTFKLFQIVVDSVVTKNINGYSVRVQYNHNPAGAIGGGGTPGSYSFAFYGIYEWIGGYEHLLGMPEERLVTNVTYGSLRCYADSLLTLVDPMFTNTCDVSNGSFSLNETTHPVIYPNPSLGKIVVETGLEPGGKVTLKILDLLGQVVLSQVSLDNKIAFDLSELNAGLYFLEVSHKGKKVGSGKILLE